VRHWPVAVAIAAALLAGVAAIFGAGSLPALLLSAALIGGVLAAVHHAEVVAHKVGEPLGTLVLALAVTIIEVALIVSMLLAGGPASASLARDAIYSAVMIICNGVLGICILLGGLRHREQSFRVEGAGPALAALVTLATLSLVLPGFTTSAPGPAYSPSQLAFAGIASLLLWGVFVFVQTVRHRDLPSPGPAGHDVHLRRPPASPPGERGAPPRLARLGGRARQVPVAAIEATVKRPAHRAVIGVAIALLVLLPETVAAVRAALANRLQTSMNLALGSALASIGLTIPAVAILSIVTGTTLTLGIDAKSSVLLMLSLVVATLSLGTGRTTVLQGAVHLVVFAAFLFLSLVP
jgi:Ca2+:H+ antiporter